MTSSRTKLQSLFYSHTAAFIEMLFPIAVVEAGDNHAARGGGVGKHAVFEIDADMGDATFAVGEEYEVAFAKLALADEAAVLLHVVSHAMKVLLIDLAVDMADKGGAIHARLRCAAIEIGRANPAFDSLVELCVIVLPHLDAQSVHAAFGLSLGRGRGDKWHLLDILVGIELAEGEVLLFKVFGKEVLHGIARREEAGDG